MTSAAGLMIGTYHPDDAIGSYLETPQKCMPYDISEVTFKEGSLRHHRKYLSLLSYSNLGNYFLGHSAKVPDAPLRKVLTPVTSQQRPSYPLF